MAAAYIVDAVRTAGGRRNGRLSQVSPADLGAVVINALLERNNLDPALIEDVIFGCVSQIGPQTFNVARTAVLASNLPIEVPGVTVDRQCGSGQQAIHFAAQAVMSGNQDMIIAGGVENMSMTPIGSPLLVASKAGMRTPFDGEAISSRYPGVEFSQFVGAERMAEKYAVSRDDLDHFAYQSHVKGAAAYDDNRFDREIIPMTVEVEGQKVVHDVDEGLRRNATLEAIQGLEPLQEGGLITAGSASQICDGSAATLIVSERALKQYGLTPLARIHDMTVVGSDPTMVLEGPIPATQKILQRTGLTIEDIAIYEVNEAFGSVPLAWKNAIGADLERLNVNGGAQALGHPLGATGAKLMATLAYELIRRKERYGLLAICEGLGTANATIIENMQR
ncbi:MAG: acetyl-CoA C-acyltransferase [Pseudomonadales bacterium]|uniref:acetyl-CoA C-acyltransferase n=1 Tax=unclassified Ketobacter TaxID=2639109 RepID=UPI000C6B6D40|nr:MULTISPECIES: acetyl-CoA C-acyltransferase [unclassified Ketobacter]MAA61047.1 acetyl-CoA C-acyltransferase [Pseudomonadales bacterium]MEC8810886.1 acetyl-CoA C-acyltransferase [Pseudomonadota bacterium]TNC89243.1 MAG: acetyl-CoA C-acyltransferase [Alcanivorax sp.]HAG93915.1 acetyl-CoA C-acetyltransferase [Gammaproteobacteria bacterium]MAQ25893.1 acetyl-CoA C-acyltransferase [Pseudomonadales bacterium]